MFTVLSNTRNGNLFLIGALAIVVLTLLALSVASAVSAPRLIVVPATSISEVGSDYYQRHPELRDLAAPAESQAKPGMACESPVDCR